MAKRIYLDYAATTPLDPEVFKDVEPYLKDKYGNASSLHSFGQEALAAIDEARGKVAHFLGCSPGEIIFTSGATEADNLAIKGIVMGVLTKVRDKSLRLSSGLHIITSAIEHPAVMETCESLKREGVGVTYIKPNKEGIVSVQDIEKAIKNSTVLVSVMYANNEVGTIQPIREIGKMIKKVNKEQRTKNKIIFHTDAVQAINYLDCNVDHLHIDLLSLSGHKIYGPKGIGALYVRKGTPIKRIQDGGEHEYGLRAGTENVPGIVGLGSAIDNIQHLTSNIQYLKRLRDKLIKEVLRTIPDSRLNGSLDLRLPNNANFSFKGIEGESLLISLDMEGFACSTGSACASKKLAPSHVLLAMGFDHLEAHSSLRVTLGKYTTAKEIDKFLKVLPKIVKRLREVSGNKSFSKKIKTDSCFE